MGSFQKYIGGSPTNMAAGMARLGLKSALITRVGDEHMGRFILEELAKEGVKLNVTALLTLKQVQGVAEALNPAVPSVVSVFAGRVADTGRDPLPLMKQSLELLRPKPKAELLWASPREVFNLMQAELMGCPIITITPDLLAKASKFGMDLEDLSLDTVKMFYNDATKSGFKIA